MKKKLKRDNNCIGSSLVDDIVDPESAREIKEKLRTAEPTMLTPEEALGIIIACGLTEDAYQILRVNAKNHGHDLYPPYYKVRILHRM